MEADLAEFEARDTAIIAVAVQDQAGAQSTASESGITYPILADPAHQTADLFGVFNLLNDNVAAPAVFIINKNGQIVWSYVAKNINDRPDNQTILANLPL